LIEASERVHSNSLLMFESIFQIFHVDVSEMDHNRKDQNCSIAHELISDKEHDGELRLILDEFPLEGEIENGIKFNEWCDWLMACAYYHRQLSKRQSPVGINSLVRYLLFFINSSYYRRRPDEDRQFSFSKNSQFDPDNHFIKSDPASASHSIQLWSQSIEIQFQSNPWNLSRHLSILVGK